MKKNNTYFPILIIALISMLVIASCKGKNNGTPKPKAYFRIDFPTKAYVPYESDCPFTFQYPEYSIIYPGKAPNPCWVNIDFPSINATIFLTYKPVEDNLRSLTEDAREFAYQHTVKAESINELSFENDSLNTYGILYNLKGNVASSVQFYVTDSVNHYLRGALYFNCRPNKDSLAPAIDFVREDIIHLMETTEWK